MDFMLALNVTIYGLGIVFLALLVLMFAIMVLTKLFSVVTGNELFPVPGLAPTPIAAPMGAGIGSDLKRPSSKTSVSSVPQEVPAAASPAPAVPTGYAASSFTMGIGGVEHEVKISTGLSGATNVLLDGTGFEIQRDAADPRKVLVDGKLHTVDVKESSGGGAMVVIDGLGQKIDLPGTVSDTLAEAPVPPFKAEAYGMLVGSARYRVELKNAGENGLTVVVDGAAFQVARENARTILVNGKPHVVEVRERGTDSAGVLIDGSPRTIQMVG